MTLLEYLNTPETVVPQELIYGQFRVAGAPVVSHQRTLLKVAMALESCVQPRGLGEVFIAPIDVVLDVDRALVLQPDALFVSSERLPIVRERIYGAPDIAIEILSPRPRIGDLDERVGWFAGYGVREVWLYHQPDSRLEIVECAGGAVASRRTFAFDEPPRSRALPEFDRTMASVLDRSPR